jgi:hypothetical protein
MAQEAEFGDDDFKPMSFTLGRFSSSEDCGPPCADFIIARGVIAGFEYMKLLVAHVRAGSRPLPLILHSPGGSIDTAQAMGDILAKLGATVVVARAKPMACDERRPCRFDEVKPYRLAAAGAGCASACALAIAGAPRRIVPEGAGLGVHKPYLDEKLNPFDKDGDFSRRAREAAVDLLESHYAKRGIDPRIMEIVRATPSDAMHWLTRDELRTLGFIDGGEQVLPRPKASPQFSSDGSSVPRQRP